MKFPASAVVYLRHKENTPDEIQMRIVFPQNASVVYSVPVIKVQKYTEEDIIGKQLYFLIPYYILKYEHISEENSLKNISREYQKLYQGMLDARNIGSLNEYDMSNIVDFTNRLVDYLFEENQKVRKEVNAVMGGEVLETYADRMIAKGRIQATIKMAKEFGMSKDELIERLMKEFSMDKTEAERTYNDM